MDVYGSIDEIDNIKSTVITFGTFDGMHIGHQQILNNVVDVAKKKNIESAAITFDIHPQHVVKKAGESDKQFITIKREKVLKMKNIGIDHLLILPFTKELSRITADVFMKEIIAEKFKPELIIIGYDHHFGFDRKGNIDFLKENEDKFNYSLSVIEPVMKDEDIISSSLIRELISNGEIEKANSYLGWNYSIGGTVVHGKGRGKTLGFPTANIELDNEKQLLLKNGVYFVSVKIGQENLQGVCNIGVRPTFEKSDKIVVEAHILSGEPDDIYGKNIKLNFHHFIRKERKFDSKELLVEQILKDKIICENYIN